MSNTGQFGGGFMARKAGGEKSNNFSLTCGLLSRYLKEKGSLGDLGLVMSRPVDGKAKPEPPRTMNLFPGIAAAAAEAARSASTAAVPTITKPVEQHPQQRSTAALLPPSAPTDGAQKKREPRAAQMTMFYGGKVIVFDDFPADKAEELMAMAMAIKGNSADPAAISPAAPAALLPKPPQSSFLAPPPPRVVAASSTAPSRSKPVAAPVAVAAIAPVDHPAQKPPLPIGSDLPIARRNSLNRFLEKRKGRIRSLAPYQVNGAQDGPTSSSETAPSKPDEKEKQPWFGPSSSGPSRSEEKRSPWYGGLGSAAATTSKSSEKQQQPWLGLAPMSSSAMELPESPEQQQHHRR